MSKNPLLLFSGLPKSTAQFERPLRQHLHKSGRPIVLARVLTQRYFTFQGDSETGRPPTAHPRPIQEGTEDCWLRHHPTTEEHSRNDLKSSLTSPNAKYYEEPTSRIWGADSGSGVDGPGVKESGSFGVREWREE